MAIGWVDDAALEWEGKRVFCRVDFNVPLTENGRILDDSRIVAALPTIRFLREKGAKIVLASHLGRPKGKPRPQMSLEPVAVRLHELIDQDIVFAEDCVGDGVRRLSMELPAGGILMLENLRFYSGEEKNDDSFARLLAQTADAYVDDAFGAAHRAHASIVGVPEHLRQHAGGMLLRQEVEALDRLRKNPKRPYVAILGGAKVSDKISLMVQLLQRVDKIIVGGAMANTFLKAKGENIGASRFEEDKLATAHNILQKAHTAGVEILLPIDHVVTTEFAASAQGRVAESNQIGESEMSLDIGPKTRTLFCGALPNDGTIFWNGPMGVFEWANFCAGTNAVAEAVAGSHAFTVAGGGDTIAALNGLKLLSHISHVSTGGGASLDFLQGAKLPGLAVLGYEG